MSKTIILGDEYDDDLREALVNVLKGLGAKLINSNWAAAGSQELETFKFELNGHTLCVEAETYIGLSLSGDEVQVNEIAKRLEEGQKMG
jgi:hypothetical protein